MSENNLSCRQNKQHIRKQKRKNSYDLLDMNVQQKTKHIISQARKQLDHLIEQLDDRIKKKIQVNQSKFMYAYRNHLDKITKQLKAIKQNYEINQKKFCTDTAILSLGKQCALFRQEAMRLHNQLQDALTDADIYKRKAEIMQGQLSKTNSSIKSLIMRIKTLQVNNQKLNIQCLDKEKVIAQIYKKIQLLQARTGKEQFQDQKIFKVGNDKQNMNISTPERKLIQFSPHNPSIIPDYSVFSIAKPPKNKEVLCKTSSPGSGKKTRLKTHSTYQNIQTQRNYKYLQFQLKRQGEDHENKIKDDLDYNKQQSGFKTFIHWLKIAREYFKDQQKNQIQIKSKSILQFIKNNEDIQNLCIHLFPRLQITKNLQINQVETAKEKPRRTLTQLSTQLMRKINPNNLNKTEKSITDNSLQLDCLDLQFILKKQKTDRKKAKSKQTIQSNLLTTARDRSQNKMNQMFKKKTIINKGNLNILFQTSRAISSKQTRIKK